MVVIMTLIFIIFPTATIQHWGYLRSPLPSLILGLPYHAPESRNSLISARLVLQTVSPRRRKCNPSGSLIFKFCATRFSSSFQLNSSKKKHNKKNTIKHTQSCARTTDSPERNESIEWREKRPEKRWKMLKNAEKNALLQLNIAVHKEKCNI